jgi:hypothetical protein
MAPRKKRSDTNCKILGNFKEVSLTVFPTKSDVLLNLFWVEFELQQKSVNLVNIRREALKQVAEKVAALWQPIPIVSQQRIIAMISKMVHEYQQLKKTVTRRKQITSHPIKINDFKSMCQRLFDIAICKCDFGSYCSCKLKFKVNFSAFI